jgi:hypothetical protein
LTCFTGEKFTTGQERFAPSCSAPQADRDAPGDDFIPAHGHETGQYQGPLVSGVQEFRRCVAQTTNMSTAYVTISPPATTNQA